MQTISIFLITAAVLLLFLLSMMPCETDHYANQVVHAGVGNIAGPSFEINMDSKPLYEGYEEQTPIVEDENNSGWGIIGKVA